jgi:hypothetical protein
MENLLAVLVLLAVHTAARPLHDQLQARLLNHKLVLQSCCCYRHIRQPAAVISVYVHAVARRLEQQQQGVLCPLMPARTQLSRKSKHLPV